MNAFRRHYTILGLLLFAAIGGSLLTPIGLNPTVGNISAGFAIGLMVALYVLRTVQLRTSEAVKAAYLDFHEVEVGNADSTPKTSDEGTVVEDEPLSLNPEAELNIPPSNLLQFDPLADSDIQPDSGLFQQQSHEVQELCSCACNCGWKSKDGPEILCGNCRRWWIRQSLRCTCDLMVTGYCECGAVTHGPAYIADDESAAA